MWKIVRDVPRTHLRICTFKGLQNVPIYAATRQGYFAARGMEVEVTYTTGSAPQLAGLARGEYDLIQTAPDNVIHFDNAPGDFGVDADAAPQVTMVLGGSNGPLGVYARPGIPGAAALHGATVGVDNPTSGFALVLRDLLRRDGLEWERDYVITVAGSTNVRVAALLRAEIAATILYPPFDLAASQAGCLRLASSPDYYPAYASLATATTRDWLESHTDTAIGYIRAFLEGLRWLHDPLHAAEAVEMMSDEPALNLDAADARAAYAAFTDARTGFGRDARLDDAGLAQVIALRAAYGNPPRSLGNPADYRDVRWYDEATRRASG